ncbi:hypothetical protein B0G80_0395 [Paraburkholderia sp. BL6669N2]|uniref:hypothetical protein n=1 Tax=Paraburkholderia sp. BL6669N2 TaxID=1938807 RepID=UPI000E229AE7|nr:hypothetical protein [Paraburkholderia sp. BL6669N2]REG57761.1 hypothetical protein B0G80_0395 [Paraburkholderia sp. BL6669N2]
MTSEKQTRLPFLALYLMTAALTVLYVRHNWGYAVDDSYITFRYADNLRSGYGLRFNISEQFYGTTAAGYALLVCGLSFLVDPFLRFFGSPEFLGAGHASIPAAGTVLSAISVGGIATILVRLVQLRASNIIGWVFALLSVIALFTCSAANAVSSHETYTFLFVGLASTYAYLIARKPVLSAVLMAVACSVRPDTALIAGMLFVVGILRARAAAPRSPLLERLRDPIRYAACLGILTVCWLLYARWNFGAFSPETLIAKKAQMLLRDFPSFNIKNLKTQMIAYGAPHILFIGALAVVVSAVTFVHAKTKDSFVRNGDLLLLALIWAGYAIGDTAAYLAFHVSIWAWYVIAIMFAAAFAFFALAIVAIGSGWAQGMFGKLTVSVAGAVGIALVLLSAPSSSLTRWLSSRNVNEHILSYIPAADFIRDANPNGTVIITCEPGAFAFRLGPKYEVVDELGLVSPGVARKIVQGDMDYPFRHWQPKYVIVSWHGLYTPEGRPWLDRDYVPVLSFTGPYWKVFGITVHVFERKPDANVALDTANNN